MEDTEALPAQPHSTPAERQLQVDGETRKLSKTKETPWKPFSLHWPYQCFLIAFSLCLLVGVETLRQLSDQRQGFGRFASTSEVTLRLQMSYSILPSIIAVVYSTMWSFVDNDIKRLEPYYQLRSPSSPTAILLLDYIYESPFMVPWRAFKMGHLLVCLSSLVFLLVSLVLPAALGALLSTEDVSFRLEERGFSIKARSLQSIDVLNGHAMSQYGAISARSESQFPPWTTAKYAVTPFSFTESPITGNETWRSQSHIYYSEPSCRRLTLDDHEISPGGHVGNNLSSISLRTNFSGVDHPACRLQLDVRVKIQNVGLANISPIFFTRRNNYTYRKYGDMSSISAIIHLPGTLNDSISEDPETICPHYSRFAGLSQLKIMDKTRYDMVYKDSTYATNASLHKYNVLPHIALYGCNTKFYKNTGDTQVEASTGRILSVVPSVEAEELTIEEFNKSNFETMLEYGMDSSLLQNVEHSDFAMPMQPYPDAIEPDNPGLWAISHINPMGPITLRQLKYQNILSTNMTDLIESGTFADAVETSLQSTFVLAVSPILSDSSDHNLTTGTVLRKAVAISVTPAFAIVSEILLSISTLSLITIVYFYRQRPSIVHSDPDSLAAQCSLVVDNMSGLGPLESDLDPMSSSELSQKLSPFAIKYSTKTESIELVELDESSRARAGSATRSARISSRLNKVPFFASSLTVTTFTLLLLTVLAALISLLVCGRRISGYIFPLRLTSFGSQLLWSFTPTVISTSIESLWVSIHRDLGLLEPWVRLRDGYATAADSLSLKYSSRPPLLVLVLSLKRRHFIMAGISLICLTTSAMNVASSSLFSEDFKELRTSVDVQTDFTATTLPTTLFISELEDAFSIVHYSLDDDITLPSWTDSRHFIILPSITTPDFSDDFNLSTATFNSVALSIGASLDCDPLTKSPEPSGNGNGFCGIKYTYTFPSDKPGPHFDSEYSGVLRCSDEKESISISIMHAWREPSGSNYKDKPLLFVGSQTKHGGSKELYACEPRVQVHSRNVLHTPEGRVLSSTPAPQSVLNTSLIDIPGKFLAGFVDGYQYHASTSRKATNLTDYGWPGLLMAKLRSSQQPDRARTPSTTTTTTTTTTTIPELADEIFARVFAVWFALNKESLLSKRNSSSSSANPPPRSLAEPRTTVITRQARIVPSAPAFAVVIALTLLYLLAFRLAVIWRRGCFDGPRLPKTIGDLIPWVVRSEMMDDFRGMNRMGGAERDARLDSLGRRYAFGAVKGSEENSTGLRVDYDELLTRRSPQPRK